VFQVPLIEHDHMAEQFAPAVVDPGLGDAVLPRASETGSLGLDTERLHGVDYLFIELCATIKDQVAWRRVVKERLAQLLDGISSGRTPSHVEVKNAPPVMRNDKEEMENAISERRYGEEIHRRDCLTMVAHERRPTFCRLRAPRRSPYPSQHGSLRNIEA